MVCLPPFAAAQRVIMGDEQTELYLSILKNKRVAIFSNHTGMVGDKHLLDLLLEKGVNVVAIFSPEHGFRGDADAGEHVSSSVDSKTGVPILSLYDGKEKRPSETSMRKFDILIVDIQDVGLRFYTYYVTMCQLMDACAQYNRKVLLLDRPNPNGHYVDGPILDMKYKSGVGGLPIPVVHGMTLGELEKSLDEYFFRTGRSFIVNLKHVQRVTRTDVVLDTGDTLPLPRGMYDALNRAIIKYL